MKLHGSGLPLNYATTPNSQSSFVHGQISLFSVRRGQSTPSAGAASRTGLNPLR